MIFENKPRPKMRLDCGCTRDGKTQCMVAQSLWAIAGTAKESGDQSAYWRALRALDTHRKGKG
jgi:hypothetical protein